MPANGDLAASGLGGGTMPAVAGKFSSSACSPVAVGLMLCSDGLFGWRFWAKVQVLPRRKSVMMAFAAFNLMRLRSDYRVTKHGTRSPHLMSRRMPECTSPFSMN